MGPRVSVALAHPRLSQQPYRGIMEVSEKGYAMIDPATPKWREVALAETDAFQKIYLKKATVEEAVSELAVKINKILK